MSIQKRHQNRLSGVPDAAALGYEGEVDETLDPYTLEEARALGLEDPRITLPQFGTVGNIRTGELFRYSTAICPKLHETVLWYGGEKPRMKPENPGEPGKRYWLLVVGPRQCAKTNLSALVTDNEVAYKPAQTGIVMADTNERATTLFRYIDVNHRNRPARVKPETIPNRETKQLSYAHGSTIRCLSAQSANAGIGRAPDASLWSECPFYSNFSATWSSYRPAVVHRRNASLIMESTPAPMTMPSAEAFKLVTQTARQPGNRWLFSFTAYYETTLNEESWDDSMMPLDDEEIRLLQMFGPGGSHPQINGKYEGQPLSSPRDPRYLTLQNIAFRRQTMRDDPMIRLWPKLFYVWYPTDPVTCWTQSGGGVLPPDVVTKHQMGLLIPRTGRHMEYHKPRVGSQYVIGVDPAGYGADHAAFQVLEVWNDKLFQVASFSSAEVSPTDLVKKIVEVAKRYNDAYTIVERNGVGLAVLELLLGAMDRGEFENLHYEGRGLGAKPGWNASRQSNEAALGVFIEELRERLVLYDEETVNQLGDYRADKLTQDSSTKALLKPGELSPGRRSKSHWDAASALMIACVGARFMGMKVRPAWVTDTGESDYLKAEKEVNKSDWVDANFKEREELRKLQREFDRKLQKTAGRRAKWARRRAPRKRK